MKLPISDRLLACANFVGRGNRVADIGCDHGYLSIHFADYLTYHLASCFKCEIMSNCNFTIIQL